MLSLLIVIFCARAGAEPSLSPLAKRVWDFFLSPRVLYTEPLMEFERYEKVPMDAQRVAVRELDRLPDVQEARARGRALRVKIIETLMQSRAEDLNLAKSFSLEAYAWADRVRVEGSTQNLFTAQSSVAAAMGIFDLGIFAKSENKDLRRIWEQGVNEELLRDSHSGDKSEEISRRALDEWKATISVKLNSEMIEQAKHLLRYEVHNTNEIYLEKMDVDADDIQKNLPLTQELIDRGRLIMQNEYFNVKTELDPDREPLRAYWFMELDGEKYFLYSGAGQYENWDMNDPHAQAFTIGTEALGNYNSLVYLTLESIYLAGDQTLTLARITDLNFISRSIRALPERMRKNEFRQFIQRLSKDLSDREFKEANLLTLLGNKDDYPLWELMSDLRWAGYSNVNMNWIGRNIEAQALDLPEWNVMGLFEKVEPKKLKIASRIKIQVPKDIVSALSARPVQMEEPASQSPKQQLPERKEPEREDPIGGSKKRNFIYLQGDRGAAKLYRTQLPSEFPDQTWTRVAPIGEVPKGTISIETLEPHRVHGRFLTIPTPLAHRLNKIALFAQGRELVWGVDYSVFRSDYSGAYVAQLKRPNDCDIEAEFVKSEPIEVEPIAAVGKARLAEVAAELDKIGEVPLARALRQVPKATPEQLSQLVKNFTLYSYFPEHTTSESKGVFALYEQFLNPEGTLCFQCGQASRLLRKILQMAYHDQPDIKFYDVSVLLRKWDHLTKPWHGALEIYRGKQLVSTLDPTPPNDDPRAPTYDHLARQAKSESLKAAKAEVELLRQNLLTSAAISAPRFLPNSSPFIRILRLASRAIQPRSDWEIIVEELDEAVEALEQWADTSVREPKENDRDLRHFHALFRPELEQIAASAKEVLEPTCEELLDEDE